MYSAQITSFPISEDPTQAVVQATLTDDSGQPNVVRNYTLPVANNPQPSDFMTLIQADIDALNNAQTQANSLASQFASTPSLAVPLSSELQASLTATPINTQPAPVIKT